MDPEADAYASCPRYDEADTAACRCPCPGCVEAHREAEADTPAEGDFGEGVIVALRAALAKAEVDAPAEAPTVEGDFERIDNPTRVTPACTLCDDSDEAFCAFHEREVERRVHTAVADGVTYAVAVPDHHTPRPDFTHGGTYPCPGPAQCADFDCPCG